MKASDREAAWFWIEVAVLALVAAIALLAGAARAQDGGVYQYDRAALLLPSGELRYVDAGVALDGPVAIARAQELERARATQASTPQWMTTVAAVVAAGVYAADQIRRWVQAP